MWKYQIRARRKIVWPFLPSPKGCQLLPPWSEYILCPDCPLKISCRPPTYHKTIKNSCHSQRLDICHRLKYVWLYYDSMLFSKSMPLPNTNSFCTKLDSVTVPLFLYLIWQIWQSCVIVSRADLSIQSPCPRPNLTLYKASAQADCLSKNHIYRVAIPHLSLQDNCSITYSVRNAFFDKVCNKQDKTVMNILVQFGF